MKKPYTLDSAFISLQEDSSRLKKRLEKLETWEPDSVHMQASLTSNLAIVGGALPVPVSFDSVRYDTKDAFDLTSFTAPIRGIYHAVTTGINFGGVGTYTVAIQHTDPFYFAALTLSLTTTYYNFSQYFEMEVGETLQVTFSASVNTTLAGSATTMVTSFSVSKV